MKETPVRLYCALSVTSFSVLLYEILILRVLPLLFPFELLFIIISLAILGLGLGGISQSFLAKKDQTAFIPIEIPILFAVSFPICTLVIIRFFYRLSLVGTVLISMIPFFLAGMILAALYHSRPETASRLYFWDLTGSALGCLFSLVLVLGMGVLPSLFFIGVIAATVPVLIIPGSFRSYTALILGGVLFLWFGLLSVPQIGPEALKKTETPLGKMLNYPRVKARWLESSWDLYSRCDVVVSDPQDSSRSIFINGGTQAIMLRDTGNEAPFSPDTLVYFPYYFGKNERILILGSGGGRDVLMARMMGTRSIRAVEINQGVINKVQSMKKYTGDIYGRKGVELFVEDGRTFIMRDKERYDRIVLSLASTFAFSDLSSIAQMENYLFTLEAFEEYFDHLTDNGVLTIFVDFHQITEKFIMTYLAYQRRKGVSASQAMKHMVAVASGRWSAYAYCLLIRKKPYSPKEADIFNYDIEKMGFKPVFLPHYSSANATDLYRIADGKMTPRQYMDKSKNHLLPATDNNPFFMEVVLNHRWKLYRLAGGIGAALVLLLGVKTWISRKNKSRMKRFYLGYFTLIGCAFMMVEIAYTKRFSFYLGIPQLNLAVVLTSILLGCGSGAAFSERIRDPRKLGTLCTILGLAIMLFSLGIEPFIRYTIGVPLAVRAFLVMVYLFPVCFLLGMPFPMGIRLAGQTDSISWLWGVNGVASVLGAILAIILAMVWGFQWVFVASGAGYLLLGIWANLLNWESE